MKTLCIRLDDESVETLHHLMSKHNFATFNGAIRYAIGAADQSETLLKEMQDLFHGEIRVDEAKFKRLNIKYGLLQRPLF